MKLITTLAILRKHDPCTEGWKKLLKHVGKDYPENGHIDFATILEANGLDDALWALRGVLPEQEAARDRLARLFACDCAEAVLHIYEKQFPDDKRPRDAVRVSRAFAEGKATRDELAAARAAAWDAARAAARAAAWDAARAAARAAARDAAWDAARDAAWDEQKKSFVKYFCQD
jgi:hypothetical protein